MALQLQFFLHGALYFSSAIVTSGEEGICISRAKGRERIDLQLPAEVVHVLLGKLWAVSALSHVNSEPAVCVCVCFLVDAREAIERGIFSIPGACTT
jgi:hypothetical protein